MKKNLSYVLMAVGVPAVIAAGVFVFNDKQYAFISLAVAVLSCISMFLSLEDSAASSREMTAAAVMTALSVSLRVLFAPLPGFKPVSALTLITGMYLGSGAGFASGAMAAVISNFSFGQGPWTPFQMFSWGMVGFFGGVLSRPLRKNRLFLFGFAALAGVLYSLLMDVWTVLWAGDGFELERYLTATASAAVITAEYAVSNVFFMAVLQKPVGGIFERLHVKYGLGIGAK